MMFEVDRVVQELHEEFAACGTLDRFVIGDHGRVEVMLECPPMAPPLLVVGKERKDEVLNKYCREIAGSCLGEEVIS